LIKDAQRKNVRESYGELAGQCFTDADLEQFVDAQRPSQIAEEYRADKSFLAIVIALQKLTPEERQAILTAAKKPLRPTWGELGRVSREGQTEAGRKAEILIAEAIVSQAQELLQLSPTDLERMYRQ
jgi:hypothetical protein